MTVTDSGGSMVSHLDLVQAVLTSEQIRLNRQTGSGVRVSNGRPSFDAVLSKTVDKCSAPSLPVAVDAAEDMKFGEGLRFVLEREGSKLVRYDGGRESSKFGILQSTAVQYGYKGDINNIPRSEVERIYKRIWEKSGAASLPFPLSTVHFDTYVNSPAAAEKILAKSRGNTGLYLRMRENRYARLVEIKPELYGKYLKGWNNRIQTLRSMVAQYGQGKDFKA